jgi:hypothetical protein
MFEITKLLCFLAQMVFITPLILDVNSTNLKAMFSNSSYSNYGFIDVHNIISLHGSPFNYLVRNQIYLMISH